MRPKALDLALAVVLATSVAGVSQAQSIEDRLRSQLVTVTTQLRAAQSGQAGIAAEKDAAEKERDALKAKLTTAEAQLRVAKRSPRPTPSPTPDLARYKADAERLGQADTQDKAQLAAAQADNGRLNDELLQLRAEHDRLAATLATDEQGLTACKAKNVQAIKVAKDILAAYDRVTVAGLLTRKEALVGLKRVQVEQLEQDFGDRIYDSRLDVKTRETPPAPAQPSQPK